MNGWGRFLNFTDLQLAVLLNTMDPQQRKEQYNADITYGTNNEFGFDYLRDNMAIEKEGQVQRGHNYSIVDEVDSVLVDEARTPLIISGPVDVDDHQFNEMKPKLTGFTESRKILLPQFYRKQKKCLMEMEMLLKPVFFYSGLQRVA